ncbi:MAG: APC family permease [Solirubrobacterales bacterium]
MESAAIESGAAGDRDTDKGLKKDAIGFLDGLAIGVDSTAPAYSLAAVIGSIVVAVGVVAPGSLLLAFVPMFFIAAAFYYMNRADQDCGTTFSWVTRAMGPWFGWIGGWAIFTTGVLVIGSLADVSAFYIYRLFDLESLKNSREAVVILAVVIIVIMTAICVIGTELSARVQRIMVYAQVGALILLVVVGAIQLIFGGAPDTSVSVSLSWLNPFESPSYSALLSALLLGVFIYWGWESAVNLTEETEDGSHSAGMAGLVSVLILLAVYVGVAVVMLGIAGVEKLQRFDDNSNILGNVADDVLGPLSFLVALAIITSGIASTQTTILPASRTSLSMATQGAFPRIFARIHPRFLTPDFSTIVIGVVATVWYVGAAIVSDNFLFDSLSALSLMIAFYYALTGIGCVIYWRHELTRSVKNFLFIGVAPLIGAVGLGYLLVESARDLADPKASYSGTELLGVGVPLAIAVAFTVIGLVLMVIWRFSSAGKPFFARGAFESVDPAVANQKAPPPAEATAPTGGP